MRTIHKQLRNLSEKEITNLLWTGGWDSTFRLLQLLFIEKREVQPVYILDLSYKSPVYELISMNEIRSKLREKGINGDQLKPTIYIDKDGIEIDDEISKAWSNIKKRRHIGKQYIWIASMCRQYDIKGIELSIQKRENEEGVDESLAYNLEESRITLDEKAIFKYFSLPVIHLTKKEMLRIAEREDWMNIMDLTWFCHHPLYHPFKKGIPCGICNPCRIAIEEGFGHKIPFILRFSGRYLKKIYNSSIMNFLK